MTPDLQQRHYDYVLGPNQDSRLGTVKGSITGGNLIAGIELRFDDTAPFVLTGRAVRCAYANGWTSQADLRFLQTRWTGPNRDYRQAGFIRESLQMAYFGQYGMPKPIVPAIVYPARSVLTLDLQYFGASDLTNLTFYFRGYKLYPKGAVPGYTYPRKFASQTFEYPVPASGLGYNETRYNQIFTVKQDADFVLRGGQGLSLSAPNAESAPGYVAALAIRDTFIKLRDHQKNPYSNDYMPFDVLFGMAGQFGAGAANIPVGPTPVYTAALGCGPSAPGLFYPEIYIPKNQQLIYDLQRDCKTGQTGAADVTFNLVGSKVFDR